MKNLKFLSILMMLMFASTTFVACSSDDDDDAIPAELVGTWTQPYYYGNGVVGIKFTSDGKAYYNEWNAGEKPNFSNVKSPANVRATKTTIRMTHSQVPGYYEEYSYVVSEDGKSVTFTLIDWEEDCHDIEGTFTKYE